MEELSIQNPWWKTGKVPERHIGEFKREAYPLLKKDMRGKKITCIIGPRQAGKTTLMYKLIDDLLATTDKNRILYLKADHPKLAKEGVISKAINHFAERLGKPIDEIESRVYIFIDEVHHVSKWARELKHWQDLKLDIKFVISGSSALRLLKGGGEKLLGRTKYTMMLPLSFREVLLNKYQLSVDTAKLKFSEIKKRAAAVNSRKAKLAFKKYLLTGGYPDVIKREKEEGFRLLLSYKDLSLERDLFELRQVRNVKGVSDLIDVLASLVTERVNYSKLGGLIQVKHTTAKSYISLLEDIYLIKESKVYSKKPYFSVRKERKTWFFDPGMVNALNMKYSLKGKEYISKLVENQVARAIYESELRNKINPKSFYWISDDGKEVDCVIPGEAVPVEVKYTSEISKGDIKGLLSFLELKGRKGVVVTEDLLEERKIDGNTILFIPAYLFLLVL